jgi:hypothetical protein
MFMEKIQLEADERVLTQVRKHWFTLFIQFFVLTALAVLPLICYAIILTFIGRFDLTSLAFDPSAFGVQLLYAYLVWLFIIWMAVFNIWTNYYLDIWTVTNKRLIAVDQRGLFNRSIGSFRLERLQDMNVEVNGFIATFLNFGTIQAQTAAGSEDEFRATGLPNPRELKAVILGAADEMITAYGKPPVGADGV